MDVKKICYRRAFKEMFSYLCVLVTTHEPFLFFGPCIFNNEDKNKPTKCTN